MTSISTRFIGATRMVHLEQAFEALDVVLTAQECNLLEAPYRPHRVLGHPPANRPATLRTARSPHDDALLATLATPRYVDLGRPVAR